MTNLTNRNMATGISMKKPIPNPQTILVFSEEDLLGDALVKLPFLKALRSAFPNACITWFAGRGPSSYADVMAPLANQFIDEVIQQDRPPRMGLSDAELALSIGNLAKRRFDIVIDTQTRTKTSSLVKKIPHVMFISGAFRYLMSDRRPGVFFRRPETLVQRLLVLVELASGRNSDASLTTDPPKPYHDLAQELLPGGPEYVGFAPGAGGQHKCWPLDHFIALAQRQLERGRVPVFLVGPDEADWIEGIKENVETVLFPQHDKRAADLTYSPVLTIALGKQLMAAVSNDSGTGHMLAAADAALLSLFGPSGQAKWRPATSRGRILTAGEFDRSNQMDAIPLDAADAALEQLIAQYSGALPL